MRLLAIDADIVAYKVAAMNERDFDFGEGGVATALTPEKVISQIEDILVGFMVALEADRIQVCLSDPKNNWRKKLDPTYKSGRLASKKPALLMDAKDYLHRTYASSVIPWLEGDDVMGILATGKYDGEVVIVSEDKDMRTIPGKVYHPHRPENGIMDISRLDADRFLLWQTICGDPTDGYPGCPGVGKTSDYVLDLMTREDPLEMWNCVIDAYASKGLKEDDAIHQARLACICRSTNWNPKKRQVVLWNPTHLFY